MIFAPSSHKKNGKTNRMIIKSRFSSAMWASSILFIFLLFVLPIYTMIQSSNLTRWKAMSDDWEHMISFNSVFDANVVLFILTFVFATLMAWNLLSYLHSSSRIDMYHSLPISRSKLFFSNFIAANLAYIIPYLTTSILAAIIFWLNTSFFDPIIFFKAILINLFFFNIFYMMASFSTIVTGSRVTSVLMTIVVYEIVQIAALSLTSLLSEFRITYVYPSPDFFLNLSPVTLYFNLSRQNWLITSALLLVFSVLSFVLYNKRPSETAGKAVWGKWYSQILKYFILFAVSIAGGLIFRSISVNESIGWLIFGVIFTTFFGHLIIEGIYNFDIRQVFKHWQGMLVFTVLLAIFVYSISNDTLGYDTRYTEPSKIASYEIQLENLDIYPRSYYEGLDKLKISTAEGKTAVDEFVQSAIQTTQEVRARKFDENADYIPASYDYKYYPSSVQVNFNLNNGTNYKREYPEIPYSVKQDLLYKIYDNPETKSTNLFIPKIDPARLEQAEVFFMPTSGNSTPLKDHKLVIQLYNALSNDYQKSTIKQFVNAKAIGKINFEYDQDPNEPYGYYGSFEIPIYEHSFETINILKERNRFSYKPIKIEDIREIEVSVTYDPEATEENDKHNPPPNSDITYEQELYTVTDPKEYPKLLESFATEEMVQYNPFIRLDDRNWIAVNLKNNVVITMHKIIPYEPQK